MKKIIGILLLMVFVFSSCIKSKVKELVIPVTEQSMTTPVEQGDGKDDELILAVKENDIERAAYLLDNGANPNAILEENLSLLQWVFRYNPQPMPLIRLLVEKGADVNYTTSKGVSVFGIAMARLPEEVLSAEILPLFENAEFDFSGKTLANVREAPYSYFKGLMYYKKSKVAFLFLTHDEVLQETLTDDSLVIWSIGNCWTSDTKDILDFLVYNGYQLNSDDPLLQVAIFYANYDAALWLLDNGVSPTKRYTGDAFYIFGDYTPLEFAYDNITVMYKKSVMFDEIELDESSPQIIEGRKIIQVLEERIAEEEAARINAEALGVTTRE